MSLHKSDDKQSTWWHFDLEAKFFKGFIMKVKLPYFRYWSACLWVTWLLPPLWWVKRRHSGPLCTLWGHYSLHHAARSVKCSKVISLSRNSFSTRDEGWDKDPPRLKHRKLIEELVKSLEMVQNNTISNLSRELQRTLETNWLKDSGEPLLKDSLGFSVV